MTAGLSADQVGVYNETGVLAPLYVLDEAEAAERLARLEAIENARAGRLPATISGKPHLLVPWMWDLVHHPRIVTAVTSLLGPDVICWGSSFFSKAPDSTDHVAWHQDATYWGLDRPEALTAWIALSDSSPDNGCLRVVPGSHHRAVRHVAANQSGNMVYGGERLEEAVSEDAGVDIVLRPGEMSLHHVLTVHGSEANRSTRRRVGFAVRYVAGAVRPKQGRMTATLVAGRDHGHFEPEIAPEGEFHPDAMQRHRGITRIWLEAVNREIRNDRTASG